MPVKSRAGKPRAAKPSAASRGAYRHGLKVTIRKDTGTLQIEGRVNGKRIRRSPASSDLRLAREEAKAIEADLLKTAWHGERRGVKPFSDAVRSYLKSDRRTKNTKALLARIMRAIGDPPLNTINQQTVNDLIGTMVAEDAAPGTIARNLITPLRAILGHANAMGWCDIPRFITPRQPKGRTKFLFPDQMERLLAVAPLHLEALLILLVTTGARMAEAIELDWRDVDLAAPRVNFLKTKTGVPRMNVPLPLRAVLALAALAHRDGPVFVTARGLPYVDRERTQGGQINYFWKKMIAQANANGAGLDPALTPHDLRHTCWEYVRNDKDLLQLARDGQWTSTRMVERYAHIMPAGQKEAILAFRHDLATDRAQNRATG